MPVYTLDVCAVHGQSAGRGIVDGFELRGSSSMAQRSARRDPLDWWLKQQARTISIPTGSCCSAPCLRQRKTRASRAVFHTGRRQSAYFQSEAGQACQQVNTCDQIALDVRGCVSSLPNLLRRAASWFNPAFYEFVTSSSGARGQ
jgi:hypothetical protein